MRTRSFQIIRQNDGYGGAVFFDNADSARLINSDIMDNYAIFGGGIALYSSTVLCHNSIFAGNNADRGGAVFISDSSISDLTNNTITANSAIYGAGVYVEKATLLGMLNTALVNNEAGNELYLKFRDTASLVYTGSCMTRSSDHVTEAFAGTVTAILPSVWGDPAFDGGYRPLSTSAMIDAGAESMYVALLGISLHAPDLDKGGDPRPRNGYYDIGAYEYIPRGTFYRFVAGHSHNVIIASDGIVLVNGDNSMGQLGLMDTTDRMSPTPLGIRNGEKGAAGMSNSGLVTSGGTVMMWGSNEHGQTGRTPGGIMPYPQTVPGLSHIDTIDIGTAFSIARDDDGNLWSWGRNDFGQLGNGRFGDNHVPEMIPGISADIVSAGDHHALIAKGDTIWAWGRNDHGQLATSTGDSIAVRL